MGCLFFCLHISGEDTDSLLSPPANLLYKAALREAAVSSSEGTSEGSSEDLSNPSLSHPYLLALGVLAVQKVEMDTWIGSCCDKQLTSI